MRYLQGPCRGVPEERSSHGTEKPQGFPEVSCTAKAGREGPAGPVGGVRAARWSKGRGIRQTIDPTGVYRGPIRCGMGRQNSGRKIDLSPFLRKKNRSVPISSGPGGFDTPSTHTRTGRPPSTANSRRGRASPARPHAMPYPLLRTLHDRERIREVHSRDNTLPPSGAWAEGRPLQVSGVLFRDPPPLDLLHEGRAVQPEQVRRPVLVSVGPLQRLADQLVLET